MSRVFCMGYGLIVFMWIILLSPTAAIADCAYWMPNGLVFPYEPYKDISDIVYDANSQRYSFLQGYQGGGNFTLWQLDGAEWKKTWEGYCTSPEGDFIGPTGLYYDPTLKSLVMMARIMGAGDQSVGAYRFTSKSGWVYITQEHYASAWMGFKSPIVYDPNRKRAILPIHQSDYGEWFLEFDGAQFHRINYQERHHFGYGFAGYDQLKRIMVFCGLDEAHKSRGYSFYEYNGSEFIEVFPTHPIPSIVMAGFAWSGELGGLLGISCSVSDSSSCGIWLYRDRDWHLTGTQCFSAWLYDARLYDVEVGANPLSVLTIPGNYEGQPMMGHSLNYSSHCRPVVRP